MLFGEVKYDTHDFWEGASGLEYMVTRNVSLTARWHSEFQWGGWFAGSFLRLFAIVGIATASWAQIYNG